MPWSNAVGTRRPAISSASWPKKVRPPVRTIDPGGVAADDVGAHEADVRQVERAVRALRAGVRELLRRHGLAGQRGLVDEQVLGLEQPQVGRDHVAGGQPHDVAGHQRLERNLREVAVAVGPRAAARWRWSSPSRAGGPRPRSSGAPERTPCRRPARPSGRSRSPPVRRREIGDHRQSEQERVEGISAADPDFLQDRRLALARDEVGAAGARGASPPLPA